MQTAERARALGARLVVLDEAAGDASVVQSLLLKDLPKPTAVVNVPFRNDNARNVHFAPRDAAQPILLIIHDPVHPPLHSLGQAAPF